MTMTRQDVVNEMLKQTSHRHSYKDSSNVFFAPINIALIKYWGKRNEELKIPMSSSVSYSSNKLGTKTEICLSNSNNDVVYLNNKEMADNSVFYKNLVPFINLFRNALNFDKTLLIKTYNNIPTASGLASSASGFASLTLALNDFFNLNLNEKSLSIIARLGSGSACRSIISALDNNARFVHWGKGDDEDGLDSYAEKITLPSCVEKNLSMLVVKITDKKKNISSTDAMRITIEKSKLYRNWLQQTIFDAKNIFTVKSFKEFGEIVEKNSKTMHDAIHDAGIEYFLPKTYEFIEFIKKLRNKKDIDIFYTMDAGANVKVVCNMQRLNDVKRILSKNGYNWIKY